MNVSGYCLTCKWDDTNVSSQFYLFNNTCYSGWSCPVGLYPDGVSKTCSNCSSAMSGCLTCTAGTYCTQCNSAAGYFNFTSTTSVNSTNTTSTPTTSTCLTASQIPRGYLLINNTTIEQCAQFCS